MFGLQRNDNAKRAKISVFSLINNHRKKYKPRIIRRLFLFDRRAEFIATKKSTQPKIKSKTKQNKQQQQVQYSVTIDTTDFFMLLETSRCRPFYQNTEEEEMSQIA